jgi:undecaprenyl-diphosphatase
MIEFLKVIVSGIIQGITEWLPISSTGHLILFDSLFPLNEGDAFTEMFDVVIQFGSILAVVVLFFPKLWPWMPGAPKGSSKKTLTLWSKILVAVVPAAVIGLLFDDFLDEHFYKYIPVAVALIVYGVAFIIVERLKKGSAPRIDDVHGIDYKTALLIGAFQVLALIPGTSRSGSTIIGAMILGVSRAAAAEFSFFLAIPVMFGASGLKVVKYLFVDGYSFTGTQIGLLLAGTVTAFVVSLVAIKFLMEFVRRHSFESFGWYRIALGLVVILYAVFAA